MIAPLLLVLLASAPRGLPAAQDGARAQYLAHCASCHGESGDGRGTTALDRPARSFREGGFSYGNTPEAVARAIVHGIPGTPMPAAPSVLSGAEVRALADFVISLGPEGVEVTAAETVMEVRERALVARGKLPPVVEGLPERPRGLLVGLPQGLSFEYRIDEVRLLAVRFGGFCDRTDWRDRGGGVLQPLGRLVQLRGGGDPGPLLAPAEGPAPATRLRASFVRGAEAGLEYDAGPLRVVETLRALPSGYARALRLEGQGSFLLRAAEPGPAWIASGLDRILRRDAGGVHEAVRVIGLVAGEILAPRQGGAAVEIRLRAGEPRELVIETLLTAEEAP